jgi:hypothetical protein
MLAKTIHPSTVLADWKAKLNRKLRNPNFEQAIETLRAHSFDVAAQEEVAGGVLVSKYGAGAVLLASASADAPVAFGVAPGALIGGRVARLLDRGYQKFLQTDSFEIPATASQLRAIHLFSEELKILTGIADWFNQALGTTSDLYEYDRLKGRDAAPPAARSPWEQAEGH